MEKKLKKVQRGATFGFVVLKILRILLIIAALVTVIALVVSALYDVNKLPLDNVKDGLLQVDLSQFGVSVPQLGQLIQNGVLQVELKDLKLTLVMLLSAALLVLAGTYVLLLVAGNLFKHMKAEDTPFTKGNVRRLRLLGALTILFWLCGLVLAYFLSCQIVQQLSLPMDRVTLTLNLVPLGIGLIFFFLGTVFSFGRAQGDALPAAQPGPAPQPEPQVLPAYEPPTAPVEPAYEPPAAPAEPAFVPEEPAYEPPAAPAEDAAFAPVIEPEAAPAAEPEAPEAAEEAIRLPEE